MEQITSRENTRVKRLARLRDDKSARDAEGCFLAEGPRLCMDALSSGMTVLEAYITDAALKKRPELAALIESAGEPFSISDGVAAKIAGTQNPQGVFAVCEKPREQGLLKPVLNGRYALLASLQDPGNVGTVIRTAEALGFDGLVLSADCPDVYSPKVLRASMGGVFRLPVFTVSSIRDEIARLRGFGVTVYAAALNADARPVDKTRFAGACAVLIGNEGAGLPEELVAACDMTVIIPMDGRADSLSAPVAAGILLWEMTKSHDR